MNFGLVIRRALQRSEIPIDAEHLDVAKGFANDNIQDIYEKVRADHRKDSATISVVAGTDTYPLDKLCERLITNTLNGPSTNPRIIRFRNPSEFSRITAHAKTDTGDARIFTYDELRHFDSQLSAASVLKIASTLANVTSGTVSVTAGSKIVTSSGSVFTMNHVGLKIKVGSDTVSYRISKFHSTAKVELETKYRGVTDSAASYKLGDVGVNVSVTGIVSGQVDTENVELDGTSTQTTSKSFTTVISVSKSDFTGGRVTVKNSAEDETVATLSPAELDIDRITIKLWPIPSASETLSYDFYKKHPLLRVDTDSIQLPQKYHRLIEKMTRADLLEWAERETPAKLVSEIDNGMKEIVDNANDTSQETLVPESDEFKGFGDQYYYDHDENL